MCCIERSNARRLYNLFRLSFSFFIADLFVADYWPTNKSATNKLAVSLTTNDSMCTSVREYFTFLSPLSLSPFLRLVVLRAFVVSVIYEKRGRERR